VKYPLATLMIRIGPFETPCAIIVLPTPAPCNVMPFVLGILTAVDHVHVPDGITMVSPFDALSMALCTATEEQLVAEVVVADA
jgi:hypothetical protein